VYIYTSFWRIGLCGDVPLHSVGELLLIVIEKFDVTHFDVDVKAISNHNIKAISLESHLDRLLESRVWENTPLVALTFNIVLEYQVKSLGSSSPLSRFSNQSVSRFGSPAKIMNLNYLRKDDGFEQQHSTFNKTQVLILSR
jgi:hypothetical protein